MLPDGAVPDVHTYDPSKLAALSDKRGTVEIGFPTGDSNLQDLANQIQVILQKAGFTSTVRDVPSAQFFALKEQSGPEVFRLGPKLASTEEQNPTSDQKPVRYGAPGIRCKEIPKVRLAASVMRIFP